jgi:hypothetical protein
MPDPCYWAGWGIKDATYFKTTTATTDALSLLSLCERAWQRLVQGVTNMLMIIKDMEAARTEHLGARTRTTQKPKMTPRYLEIIRAILRRLVVPTRGIMSKLHSVMLVSQLLDILRVTISSINPKTLRLASTQTKKPSKATTRLLRMVSATIMCIHNQTPPEIAPRVPCRLPQLLGRNLKPYLRTLGRLYHIALDLNKAEQLIAVDHRNHVTTQTKGCRMAMMLDLILLHTGAMDLICEPPTYQASLAGGVLEF